VVRFELAASDSISASPPSESQSQGIAVDIEQPGAAVLLRAPTHLDTGEEPAAGAALAPSPAPSSTSDLLLFATHVRSSPFNASAAGSTWLSDPAGDDVSARLQRSPSCSSLLSVSRCAALGRSDDGKAMPPGGGSPKGPFHGYSPGLVVAGDLIVTGRAMSPTVDALVEVVALLQAQFDSLNFVVSRLDAAGAESKSEVTALRSRAQLAGSTAIINSMRVNAAVSNARCELELSNLVFDEPVASGVSFTELPVDEPGLPAIRNSLGTVQADNNRNSGLPFSALSGVPDSWGLLNTQGIRAHAAVTVVVPKAAAFGGGDRPRKYAWMYVTGGFDAMPCWDGSQCRIQHAARAMDHAYRLDLVSLRWEALPSLPTPQARHAMVWVPELGAVMSGPGQAIDDVWATNSAAFTVNGSGVMMHALAVPEAFNASHEWSRPTRLAEDSTTSVRPRAERYLYEHNTTASNADGWPRFTPPVRGWSSRGLTLSAGRWESVANLSSALGVGHHSVLGLTNASLAVVGSRVYVYGGGVWDGTSLRVNLNVLEIDLERVEETSSWPGVGVTMPGRRLGEASAVVRRACTLEGGPPHAWSLPIMSAAVFPIDATTGTGAGRLYIAGGAKVASEDGYPWYNYKQVLADGMILPMVLDLSAPLAGSMCSIREAAQSLRAWSGFGAAQVTSGDILMVGGQRIPSAGDDPVVGEIHRSGNPLTTPLISAVAPSPLPVHPVTGRRLWPPIAMFAAQLDVHSNQVLVGGVLSALQGMPLSAPPPNSTMNAKVNWQADLDSTDNGLQVLAKVVSVPTVELWWFGGDVNDPSESVQQPGTMRQSDRAVLRRVGDELFCGELGKARGHSAAIAHPLDQPPYIDPSPV